MAFKNMLGRIVFYFSQERRTSESYEKINVRNTVIDPKHTLV